METTSLHLNGWKEVANYLHSSVRSVQRYERAGLPVYRPFPSARGHVMADSVAIDRWLHRRHSDTDTALVVETRNNLLEHQHQIEELRRQRQELQKSMAQLFTTLGQVGQFAN